MRHIHAIDMKLYADDAIETETPWDRWEYIPPGENSWYPCIGNPTWEVDSVYRRKQDENKLKWTTEKPTEAGYYAWREIGNKRPFMQICTIYKNKSDMTIRFGNNSSDHLYNIAAREWFGPLPE